MQLYTVPIRYAQTVRFVRFRTILDLCRNRKKIKIISPWAAFGIGILITLTASPANGQNDILSNAKGPYIDLARGASWAASGLGGVNNNFIFNSSPDLGACLYVANTAAGAHSFTVTAAHTADQRLQAYSTAWTADLPILTASVAAAGSAGSTWSGYIPAVGAARQVVIISNGSGAGTADIFVVQTSAPGCTGAEITRPSATGCSNFVAFNMTASGYTRVLTNSSTTRSIRLCYLSLSSSASVDFIIAGAATSSCTSPAVLGGTWRSIVSLSLDVPNLSLLTAAGADLCFSSSATANIGGIIGYLIQ